jgi:hypothetical protein
MLEGISFEDTPDNSYHSKCDRQISKINWLNFMSYFSTMVTVLINSIIRKFIIEIYKTCGYLTRTEETKKIMFCIFVLQFLNSGLFILLLNSDLSELNIPYLSQIFTTGIHRDFTAMWYEDVGK